jgi:hypothetical protein
MRTFLLSGLCLVTNIAFACAKEANRDRARCFVEGKIRIVSPVRQTKNKGGLIEMHYNDGGTMMIRIVDADGKRFDVYVDHRLDRERQWGTIYLNGYPDTKKSIRLSKQREFKDSIMNQLLSWHAYTDAADSKRPKYKSESR